MANSAFRLGSNGTKHGPTRGGLSTHSAGSYCSAVEQTEGWSQRIAAHVGRRIAYFRAGRGPGGRKLSTQALADRTRDLGHPLDRSVIAKLEGGQRQTISVPELVILARALEVPPVELLYPLGAEPEVEILPGQKASSEDAMLWFTGWHDLFKDEVPADRLIGHGHRDPATGLHEWYETPFVDAAIPIHLYDEHRELVQEYEDAVGEAMRRLGRDAPARGVRDEVAMLRRRIEDAIRGKRAEMRSRGLTVLPGLPKELEHLR